jgi:hypothetical protein
MSPDQVDRLARIRTLWLELDSLANVSCHSPRYEGLVLAIKALSDDFRAHNTPDDIAVIVLDPVIPTPSRPRIKKARPTKGVRGPNWGYGEPAKGRT